ncbi:2'3'-cyclic-nucleotide 3'-phosphodiesterase [Taenia solium]|eukprot:TsM_000396100 transcript=TsM_000396100 gene=TsM_000396100
MGQKCAKPSSLVCFPRLLHILGIRRSSHRRVDKYLIQEYSDDSNSSSDAITSRYEYVDYPFLCDREIGEWVVFTRFMIILRGPPGSGKSCLASYVKIRFPTAHICSTDNHLPNANYFQVYRFDSERQEAAHRKCEEEAKLYARRGVSPLVIDISNIRSYECRPYTEIARQFDYNVIMVIPRTPWRFDVRSLAENNVHHFSAEMISSMIAQFEPIIYPLYYGWVFAGLPSCNIQSSPLLEKADNILPNEVTEKMVKEFHDAFFAALDVPYIHRRLALICGFDQDVDRDQLATFWSSAINPCFDGAPEPLQTGKISRPHCTAFFAHYGHVPGSCEYAQRSTVREALLGSIRAFCVEGLFITKRTVGLRIHLTDPDQFAVWGGLDNESVDGCVPARSRPPGCRAHVTLALASGVPAVETGFDALRIMDAELDQRPDVCIIDMPDGILREILASSSANSKSPDYVFYYQFSKPKTVRLMYTAFY